MGAMIDTVSCSCGYTGPAATEGSTVVCPVCREPLARREREQRWKIPCPNGHVFKAPESWLGRRMICPKCNEPFVLTVTDSLEKRAERRRRRQAEEAKFAKVWLNRAIWALILGAGFIVSLVVFSLLK